MIIIYRSFNKSLTEFTYLVERISIVTKEFFNKLDKDDLSYDLINEIYKSTQSINYEFIKLCYNIRSDGTINIEIPDLKDISIPINNIKTIVEYKEFVIKSIKSLKSSLNLICSSAANYSLTLNREIENFKLLINKL